MRVLTDRQIEGGVEAGRIDPCERDLQQSVDPDTTGEAALTAFINEVRYKELDPTIVVNEESQDSCLRLVALSGG